MNLLVITYKKQSQRWSLNHTWPVSIPSFSDSQSARNHFFHSEQLEWGGEFAGRWWGKVAVRDLQTVWFHSIEKRPRRWKFSVLGWLPLEILGFQFFLVPACHHPIAVHFLNTSECSVAFLYIYGANCWWIFFLNCEEVKRSTAHRYPHIRWPWSQLVWMGSWHPTIPQPVQLKSTHKATSKEPKRRTGAWVKFSPGHCPNPKATATGSSPSTRAQLRCSRNAVSALFEKRFW